MTNFIDARATALGITGSLTTDQRIALDANAQMEKLGLAVKTLANTPAETALILSSLEATRLHVFYDRALYASQAQALGALDTSSIPAAPNF